MAAELVEVAEAWQEHAVGLVAKGGVHESELWESAVVGEEVVCAAQGRLAKGGRKRSNECATRKWGRWCAVRVAPG